MEDEGGDPEMLAAGLAMAADIVNTQIQARNQAKHRYNDYGIINSVQYDRFGQPISGKKTEWSNGVRTETKYETDYPSRSNYGYTTKTTTTTRY